MFIQRSICRQNVLKIVSIIQQPGNADLNILISENISEPNDIPTTLIYHDSIEGGRALAHDLRRQLPPHLHKDSKKLIRIYAGYLADDVRALYEEIIQSSHT